MDADDAGDIATDALQIAVRVEREVTDLEAMINAADARLADWPTVSAVTAALDFYAGLRDAIAGRIDTAETIVETNAALRTVLEDANLAVRDGKVWGEFFIRADDRTRIGHLGGLNEDLPDIVMEFFPDDIAGRAPPDLVRRTERQTLVYRCPGGLHEPDGSTPRYGLARNPTAAMPAGLVLDTVRSAPSDG